MKKPGKTGSLDPAAVCRSSDPMAVRELLTKIGDKWTIFLVLSLDLLGGRARFSSLERAVPAIWHMTRDSLWNRTAVREGATGCS